MTITSDKEKTSIDPKVKEIIKTLRDEDFGNEEQRKKFVGLILNLYRSRDEVARKTFRKLGQVFSEIGDELLKQEKVKRQKNNRIKEKSIQKYKLPKISFKEADWTRKAEDILDEIEECLNDTLETSKEFVRTVHSQDARLAAETSRYLIGFLKNLLTNKHQNGSIPSLRQGLNKDEEEENN